jgi:hypothetical protein
MLVLIGMIAASRPGRPARLGMGSPSMSRYDTARANFALNRSWLSEPSQRDAQPRTEEPARRIRTLALSRRRGGVRDA